MIRHCVFVKFRDEFTEADRQAIYARVRALGDHLPGIVAASFGANVSPEGLGQGFDGGFTMDFESAAARDGYLADSEHKKAGQELVSMLAGGRDGVVVFDLEI